MSKIHYFQRYSSVENTVTNNTLQLLARIYDYSTATASTLLTNLTGEPIDIGVEIAQQRRVGNAVPDGMIIQRSFKILIEAKVDSPVDAAQLVRHAGTFGTESQKILLLLTKKSNGTVEAEIADRIQASYPDVVFKSVTYEDICNAVKGLFKEHEAVMLALVEDFQEYCNDAALFDQTRLLMRIVPCGQSAAINTRHAIYFQPSDRGYTPHAYVGIYANKAVRALLKVTSVFDVDASGPTLVKTLVQGEATNAFDGRLHAIIRDAKTECGYNIVTGHRFFCGTLTPTNFRKTSTGGIQGARIVNLRDLLGPFGDATDIAAKLSALTWK